MNNCCKIIIKNEMSFPKRKKCTKIARFLCSDGNWYCGFHIDKQKVITTLPVYIKKYKKNKKQIPKQKCNGTTPIIQGKDAGYRDCFYSGIYSVDGIPGEVFCIHHARAYSKGKKITKIEV